MTTVNIHEAKTHLSRLLERVEAGEEITIARAGTPIARLVMLEPSAPARRTGFLAGAFNVPDDFDQMAGDELVDLFEARE